MNHGQGHRRKSGSHSKPRKVGHGSGVRPLSADRPAAQTDTGSLCPRCLVALTDPDGLGLCPRCGYSRSLEQGERMFGRGTKPAARGPLGQWGAVLGALPAWAWCSLGVMIGLLPLGLQVNARLAAESPVRAVWGTAQLLLGLAAVAAAQVWALKLLRTRGEKVGALDLVFPLQLWRLTLVGLPDTRGPVFLGAGGLLAVVTALFGVGGQSYWWTAETPPDEPEARHVKTPDYAAQQREFRQSLERLKQAAKRKNGEPVQAPPPAEASSSVAPAGEGSTGKEARDQPAAPPARPTVPDARPTSQCVVIGYLRGDDGQLAGLVLATLRDGQLTYAGTVRRGFDKKASDGLLQRLAGLKRATPLLVGVKVEAQWVRPEVFCEVHQSGVDEQGALIDPNFKGLMEDEDTPPSPSDPG